MSERIAKIPMKEYLDFLKIVEDLDTKGFTSVDIPNAFSYVKNRRAKYYSDSYRKDLEFYTNLDYSSSFFKGTEFDNFDDLISYVEDNINNAHKANKALQKQVVEFISEMESETWKPAYEQMKSKLHNANSEIKLLNKENEELKKALDKTKSKKRWWQI